MTRWRLVLATALALVSGCSAPPHRADEVVLTYGTPFSIAHPYSKADQHWIAEVARRSGGRLRIVPYWGGSLIGSDNAIAELRHGVTDIAAISPIYARSGMALIKAQSGFYQGARTQAQQLAVYHCLAARFPAMDAELHGLRPLAVQGGALIHIVTRDRPIRTIADLRGLRLRAPSELVPVMRPLGVDVLTMPMAATYSSLSKGMIDGVVAAPDTLKTFHFGEIARHVALIAIYRGAYPSRAISDRAWRRLDPQSQRLLTSLDADWERELAAQIGHAQEEGLAAARADHMTLSPFAPAEQRAFDALYRLSAERTAADLDAQGLPGTAMLRTARAILVGGACPATRGATR